MPTKKRVRDWSSAAGRIGERVAPFGLRPRPPPDRSFYCSEKQTFRGSSSSSIAPHFPKKDISLSFWPRPTPITHVVLGSSISLELVRVFVVGVAKDPLKTGEQIFPRASTTAVVYNEALVGMTLN